MLYDWSHSAIEHYTFLRFQRIVAFSCHSWLIFEREVRHYRWVSLKNRLFGSFCFIHWQTECHIFSQSQLLFHILAQDKLLASKNVVLASIVIGICIMLYWINLALRNSKWVILNRFSTRIRNEMAINFGWINRLEFRSSEWLCLNVRNIERWAFETRFPLSWSSWFVVDGNRK